MKSFTMFGILFFWGGGVSDTPDARSEYERYVTKIRQLAEQDDDPDPISKYLREIVFEKMGLPSDKEKCDFVADLILRHKHAIKRDLA